ncbi:MAG: SRPBCC family protein [Marinagarivorans sp.]
MQNTIQREITLRASQQRVYAAIADPAQVVQWFPETLEGTYAVGEQPIFGFGAHGRNQIYIEAARPYDYFAYRWVPGAEHFVGDVLSVANTLVEFRLSDLGDGRCTLTLTETGFAHLPAEVAAKCFTQNSGGWDFMLARLVNKITEV